MLFVSSILSLPWSSILIPVSSHRTTVGFLVSTSMHNTLFLHSSIMDTRCTRKLEFSSNFGSICLRTFNLSDLKTMYLSGSCPEVSRKQQQQQNVAEATTRISITTNITTILPCSKNGKINYYIVTNRNIGNMEMIIIILKIRYYFVMHSPQYLGPAMVPLE